MQPSLTCPAIFLELFNEGFDHGIAIGFAAGRLIEIRSLILKFGQKSIGPANKKTIAGIALIEDLERLELMFERIPDVGGWKELLAE